jgi:hypothetical protein
VIVIQALGGVKRIIGDIKPIERNRFAVEGVEPDRLAVRVSARAPW